MSVLLTPGASVSENPSAVNTNDTHEPHPSFRRLNVIEKSAPAVRPVKVK